MMLEKWKQRAIQMNFKKAVLVFLAVSFVLVLGFSAVLYGNFKDRTDQWESAVKTSREYQNREKGEMNRMTVMILTEKITGKNILTEKRKWS